MAEMARGKFPVNLTELSIDTTLRCGQSFRWKRSQDGSTYSCALRGRLISLRQDATHLHYLAACTPPVDQHGKRKPDPSLTPKIAHEATSRKDILDDTEIAAYVRHYLNISTNLENLYKQWSAADLNFKKKAPKFTGVRILRQEAWEALVGFICSSNNNIARICQMMEKLCIHYGPLIGYIDSQPFYDMPTPAALTGSKVEGHLRELGFGYRAKYIHQTAVMVTSERESWLDSLRNPEAPPFGRTASTAGEMKPGGRDGYRAAHEALLSLQGVGPKVADCVCLMGLGWGEAVPVDTHVWQIAQRDYKFGKGKNQSLTKQTYDAVGDHFRKLWGKEAGWAHSVLFTADLRAFSDRLTAKTEVKVEHLSSNGEPTEDQSAVKVKLEVAPALPDDTDSAAERPIVTAEESLAVPSREIRNGKIATELKRELAEDLLRGDTSLAASDGLRRSKRQKKA